MRSVWKALVSFNIIKKIHISISNFQPFGKRSGSKADNRVLYPKILLSMARVVKPTSGRAVLLTQDKTSMFKVCFYNTASVWNQNMNGFQTLNNCQLSKKCGLVRICQKSELFLDLRYLIYLKTEHTKSSDSRQVWISDVRISDFTVVNLNDIKHYTVGIWISI